MNYEVATAEKSTVKVTMKFSPEEWTEANGKAYLRNRHKYSVNGFRKGKAPKHILEAFYGKGLFYEDALNLLLEEHYDKTLEAEKDKIDAVGRASFEIGEGTDLDAGNIILVATVPVKPDITLGAYKGIKITKYEYTVTDADVDKEVDAVRANDAKEVDVTDRPAQLNDTVNIDFAGKLDGKAFEGGTAEGYDLTLGSHAFIPGFEEGVVGMTLGEVRDITVTFPEDYQNEDLKGKAAVFTVTLHKITGKELPALDEEYLKARGFDSLEAYREKIRTRLENIARNRSRNNTENSILEAIAKNTTAELPDALVEQEEEASMQRLESNLMYQGINMDSYLRMVGSTREEYKKNFETEARAAALNQLIIEKLIDVENITATEEEIEQKIAEQAASVGKEAEEYKKTMDPRQRLYIESDIKVTKLFDFLMANNEMVTEEKA